MLAVITGASRGIGERYARQLAARGPGLHLVARHAVRLAPLAAGFRPAHRGHLEAIRLDLADADGAVELYAEVRARRSAGRRRCRGRIPCRRGSAAPDGDYRVPQSAAHAPSAVRPPPVGPLGHRPEDEVAQWDRKSVRLGSEGLTAHEGTYYSNHR